MEINDFLNRQKCVNKRNRDIKRVTNSQIYCSFKQQIQRLKMHLLAYYYEGETFYYFRIQIKL